MTETSSMHPGLFRDGLSLAEPRKKGIRKVKSFHGSHYLTSGGSIHRLCAQCRLPLCAGHSGH